MCYHLDTENENNMVEYAKKFIGSSGKVIMENQDFN